MIKPDLQFAQFKRVLDYYSADPSFRKKMHEDAVHTLSELGFDSLDANDCLKGIEAFLRGRGFSSWGNPYLDRYIEWEKEVLESTERNFGTDRFRNPEISRYLTVSMNRCRTESMLLRMHSNARLFPIAIELGVGCRCRCPFCAFEAGEWKENFEYTPENAALWRDILRVLLRDLGPVAKEGTAYFATEPFDNPDYEKFLSDYEEIFGGIPQTTTALADCNPERTRRFIEWVGKERLMSEERIRFSVRTLNQFKRIISEFSPEELEFIELIANNPESVNMYSDSGRAAKKPAERFALNSEQESGMKTCDGGNDTKMRKVTAKYSVCCISGLLVNMVNKTMMFIEPELPCEEFPKGYRILEERAFSDADDFSVNMNELYAKYAIASLPKDDPVCINRYVRVRFTDHFVELTGPGVGYRIKRNVYTEEGIRMLEKGAGFREIVRKTGLPDEWEQAFYESMNELYFRGFIRIMYP